MLRQSDVIEIFFHGSFLFSHTDLADLTDIWPLAIDASVSRRKSITAGDKIREIREICVTYFCVTFLFFL